MGRRGERREVGREWEGNGKEGGEEGGRKGMGREWEGNGKEGGEEGGPFQTLPQPLNIWLYISITE